MLNNDNGVYTCNVYLVLGTWSVLADINTLVDTGSDGSLIAEVEKIYTGVGKKPVDRVILTHDHFDHSGGLPSINKKYKPEVYAFSGDHMKYSRLTDGQSIRMGDRDFEVVHTPGHSSDSICLYCKAERVLFSGDTSIQIKSTGGTYERAFADALERLAALKVETIYPGHGNPINGNAEEVIRHTLTIVNKVITS